MSSEQVTQTQQIQKYNYVFIIKMDWVEVFVCAVSAAPVVNLVEGGKKKASTPWN